MQFSFFFGLKLPVELLVVEIDVVELSKLVEELFKLVGIEEECSELVEIVVDCSKTEIEVLADWFKSKFVELNVELNVV